jgi:hypothetical protein
VSDVLVVFLLYVYPVGGRIWGNMDTHSSCLGMAPHEGGRIMFNYRKSRLRHPMLRCFIT